MYSRVNHLAYHKASNAANVDRLNQFEVYLVKTPPGYALAVAVNETNAMSAMNATNELNAMSEMTVSV